MGNRGKVIKSLGNGRYTLVHIDDVNKQPVLSQDELLELDDKLFKFKVNLKGTYFDNDMRNEVVIVHE